jgi:hypothetical protein
MEIDQLPNSSAYTTQIQTLRQQVPAVLDDFKKYYVFYHKNPEYNEYQQMFENIKSNMQTINANIFTTTNDVESNTENINKKLFALNVLIRDAKRKNTALKRRLGRVESASDGSDEMVSNYKELYNLEYVKNWGMFVGIVLSIVISSTVLATRQPIVK